MRKFVLISMSVVLVACQPMPVYHHREGTVPVSVQVDDAALWLEEWHQVLDLPKDKIALILKSWEADFARSNDPRTRLRLALLLTTGPVPVRDQQRARALIEGMDRAETSETTLALAALLQQIIEEQLWSSDRIVELKGESRQLNARVAELEQQLQELTNIEQSIQQRETPGTRKEKP
ncbi:hypothetical protein MNBD_GAMMA13-353 [hydrothermal vent metagenome]|uniref:Uncharacterized protein n=1 Tax=hydrothermal vent metagenome TaxID=652676 RepID=A0A3B0YP59_9ZZZZ